MSENENSELEKDKKRKRSDNSSISDLDCSISKEKLKTDKSSSSKTSKSSTNKKKKSKKMQEVEEQNMTEGTNIKEQLTEINKKLSNVITKDDGYLKTIIQEMMQQMKEQFLQSVFKRIEILEGKLFEKEEENDKLRKEVKYLKEKVEEHVIEDEKHNKKIETDDDKTKEKFNNLEQYSRRNNIRVTGITETGPESAEKSTSLVIETLNTNMPGLELKREDIDIAHRVGKKTGNKRQIIVKFVSRMKKENVMKNRKKLKTTGIFVNEDLTVINQHVLSCIRKKKQSDEVDIAWSKNGTLFYKTKLGDVKIVPFNQFQNWMDLAWP